jgi:hypothetical protein
LADINAQLTVNQIYNEFAFRNLGRDAPRVHPVITLIGEEWGRMECANEDTLNFDAFSTARWIDKCKQKQAEQVEDEAQLPEPLTTIKLTMLLRDLVERGDCHRWWLPSQMDVYSEEEDEEMSDPGA